MTAAFQDWFGWSYEAAWFTATIAGILLIALPVMLAVAMVIYADRKIWAAMALRRGPNVVGPFGLLQSFADGLKVFLQETIVPTAANKGLFLIAPIITFTVALLAWAVIPFNSGAILADINVGLLYVLAISSLGVYGVVIAGWSSNSKYPFFSAMRAAAQMISYEVSIGFILVCVVLWAGSFNLNEIVQAQQSHVWIVNGFVANPLLFPMWVMFLISSMAETARAPFDLTEAESELVAGYQTEYSSMAFALYWLGEYANVLLMCTLNAVLFFGGYLPPLDWAPLYVIPGWIWLFAKIGFFFFIFSWVKATVPRYRYDQLMRLGWKVFLPVSLGFVVLVSGYLMLTRYGQPSLRLTEASAIRTFDCRYNAVSSNEDLDEALSGGGTQALTLKQYEFDGRKEDTWQIAAPSDLRGVNTGSVNERSRDWSQSVHFKVRAPHGKQSDVRISFGDSGNKFGFPGNFGIAKPGDSRKYVGTCNPVSLSKGLRA
jgi:NADH-quinone oxidoreductase subunit H